MRINVALAALAASMLSATPASPLRLRLRQCQGHRAQVADFDGCFRPRLRYRAVTAAGTDGRNQRRHRPAQRTRRHRRSAAARSRRVRWTGRSQRDGHVDAGPACGWHHLYGGLNGDNSGCPCAQQRRNEPHHGLDRQAHCLCWWYLQHCRQPAARHLHRAVRYDGELLILECLDQRRRSMMSAAALTRLALRRGAESSCRAGMSAADPSEAAKEYEAPCSIAGLVELDHIRSRRG